jgi:hypothetical protein
VRNLLWPLATLLPVQTSTGLGLTRGAMLDTQGAPHPVHAPGSILASGQELSLFEEECRAKAPI